MIVLAIAFIFGLTEPLTALAATAPPLGVTANFSVLSALKASAAAAGTTVQHNLGLSPGLETDRTGNWTVSGTEYFGVGGLSETAQDDALTAFNNLAGQTPTALWSSTSPAPGVWNIASDTTFTGTLTLDGDYDDVWVFQIGRDMTFSGSVIMAGNAQPCNVFWQIGRSTTIASGSTFVGTLIAHNDITVVSGATVDGRIMSLTSNLTTDGNVISGPTCVAAPATLHIIKHVVNDNGGIADASDFTMNVTGTNVSDSSFAGAEDPGTTITLDAGTYSVDEDAFSGYTKSLGANCSGTIAAGDSETCTITNDDNAQTVSDDNNKDNTNDPEDVAIKIKKTANPSTLLGSGSVTYTYKVTNEGDVSLKKISVKDDKCSPVKYVSGDKDRDSKIDKHEEWKYTCTKTVSATETNKVTAKGTANSDRVKDTDTARVVVSSVPGFPNAGIGPDDKNNNLCSSIISRIFSLFHFSFN